MNLKAALAARFGDAPEPPDGLEALESMAARGSCRAFRQIPVPGDLVRTLCAVALSAPSKSDLQQRDILIVTEPEIRARLDAVSGFEWLPQAPVFLVFLANHARFHRVHEMAGVEMVNDHFDGAFNAIVDAAVALGAFVAAAEAAGLGCCPISVIRNQPDAVADALDLPPRVIPVAGLALGWPAEAPRISPRLSLAATVHENRFPADQTEAIREYDRRRGWPGRRRLPERFGDKPDYGWSDDKARQYAEPQRAGWGAFLRRMGFSLD